jgi:RimJ/RimL family protein N-acetyltransferase
MTDAMPEGRFAIDWSTAAGELAALEPTLAEVAARAALLAAGYNEPRNAELMGHGDPIGELEVVDHYEAMLREGNRMFLLYRANQLVGDADLRGIANGTAEFAFMIAVPAEQGKGMGTAFALMLHAFAFEHLDLSRVYASVVPHNVASRRVFEKLGYVEDAGPEARAYADEPGDVTLAIDRDTFVQRHLAALRDIRISRR